MTPLEYMLSEMEPYLREVEKASTAKSSRREPRKHVLRFIAHLHGVIGWRNMTADECEQALRDEIG